MGNDINDKNYPFSGSAKDLSSMDETPSTKEQANDKVANFTQDTSSFENLSLSQQLIKLRTSFNLNIEQLADITKIRSEFIEALEREDFSKLPGIVFAKGFVKNLARFYKINDSSLMQAFDKACNQGSSNKDSLKPQSQTQNANQVQTKAQAQVSNLVVDSELLSDATKTLSSNTKESSNPRKIFAYFSIVGGLFILLALFCFFKFSSSDPYIFEDTGLESMSSSEGNQNEFSASTQTQPEDNNLDTNRQQVNNQSEVLPSDTASSASASQPGSASTVTQQEGLTPPQEDSSLASTQESRASATPTPGQDTLNSTVNMGISCDTTVRTKTDYDTWKEELYHLGNISFDFKKVFHIFITDSSCVNLSFNGVQLKDLSLKGKERRLTFFRNQEVKETN